MDKKEESFKEQVGLVIRALRADLESVRELAIVQLSLFGSRATPYIIAALVEALKEEKQNARARFNYTYTSPGSSPGLAVDGLLRTLEIIADPTTIQSVARALPRKEAVIALAKIGTDEALSTIIENIPNWYKPKDSGPLSIDLCDDDDVKTIFSYFNDEKGAQLRKYLEKTDAETKIKTMKILTLISDTQSSNAALEQLKNEDIQVKIAVIQILRKFKAKDAVPQLIDELFKVSDKGDPSEGSIFGDREYRSVIEELCDAIAELGEVKDWIKVASHRPDIKNRRINAKIVNSGEIAVPSLMKLLNAKDQTIQQMSADMIAKIKRGAKVSERERAL